MDQEALGEVVRTRADSGARGTGEGGQIGRDTIMEENKRLGLDVKEVAR